MSKRFQVRSARVGALVFTLVLLVFTPLSPVQAVDTGVVHGTVAAAGGATLDNIEVSLERFESDQWVGVPGKFTTTVAGGAYSFSGVADGTYQLVFEDARGDGWDGSRLYVTAVKDGVVITPGDTDADEDTTYLVLGGSVTGHVQGDDGLPLAGVDVRVYPEEDDSDFGLQDETDAAGNFTVTGLADGKYSFAFFKDGYVNEFYRDQPFGAGPSFTTGNFVDVTEGVVVPVELQTDVVLSVAGSISGTVTLSGGPSLDRCVSYAQAAGGDFSQGGVATSATGEYTIPGMQPGAYVLLFNDCNSFQFVPEYYNNSPTRSGATTVTVDPGQDVPNINAVLELPAPPPPPPPPAAVTPAPRFASSLSGGIKGGKKKATVSVKVRFSNVKTKKVKGAVYVYEGTRLVKKGSFKKGKGSFKVKAAKGVHTYTVTFNGGAKYGTKSFTKTVRVK